MSVSFLSLNVRGLKNILKRKALFIFCKEQKANVIFLQETHSITSEEKFWKQQWGDEIFFSHGTSHSAGVMILFHKNSGKIIEHKSGSDGHWVMVATEIHNQKMILLCVYGYNIAALNRELMLEVERMIQEWKITHMTENVIIGGDFNIAPDSWMDRFPHRGKQPLYDEVLKNLCHSLKVIDIWRLSNPTSLSYTWFNASNRNHCSRLDYWLTSQGLCKESVK